VKTGSFTIPTTGETSTVVFFRVSVTVTDSGGLTATGFVDLKPKIVKLSILSDPPGAMLTLDGQPSATLQSVKTVAGMTRSVGVVSPQTINGTNYVFDSWSDAGDETHDIAPVVNTKLTAKFRAE